MKNKITAVVTTCLLILISACEQPKSPNFNLENKIETPIATEREYKFLGAEDALIDTTKESLDSLFTVDDNGLVSLTKQKNINLTNFGDVFPEIHVEPTDVSAKVGELNLGTFTSGRGSVAEVSFEEVMGQSSGGVRQGMPVPDQSNRRITDVEFTSEHFKSATIKEGLLVLVVENQIGFDIDEFSVEVISQGKSLGNVHFPGGPGLAYGEKKTGELPVGGERLEDIEFTITVSWAGKEMQTDNPGPISINEVGGKDIRASEVEAYIPVQRFSVQGLVKVDSTDDTEFKFTEPDHYVELESGHLRIHNIDNQLDLNIDTLQVSFPDIRRPPYTPADSLVVRFQGDSKIYARTNNAIEKSIDLANLRIYGEGQSITYNIYAVTEDTRESKEATLRTIHEDDNITANVELDKLNIRKAYGVVMPRRVLINNDEDSNGKGSVDLFNNSEAEVVNIEDQKSLLKQIEGLQFAEPRLNIMYDTNIGIETTIYAAIAGVNANGKVEYLRGKPGSEYYVDTPSEKELFKANGSIISNEDLIKFKLTKSEDGTVVRGANNFDKSTTNVDDFLSNLPTEVRVLGIASLNDNPVDSAGILVNPIQFKPSIGIGLPLHLSAETSTISDTLDVNLKSLPKESDKHYISEATFIIDYINNLPFRMGLSLVMLDEEHNYITRIPLSDQNQIVTFRGAPINSSTQFAERGSEGEVVLKLNNDQFSKLSQTRHMVIQISFNTTNQEEVKVRAEDSIALSLQMKVNIESEID